MRITIVANPAAGTAQDRTPVEDARDRLRQAGHEVRVLITRAPRDAERLAREAAAEGTELLVAAGGDGTLNEVVNGIASAPGGLAACTLGILPIGTGNDFARTLGLEELADAVDALTAGHVRTVDVVHLDRRVFLNASAGGFTAETSSQVTSGLKQAVGKLAYLIGGARAFLEYEPVTAHVEGAGRVLQMDLQLFAICNGAYIGGGHQLAPGARVDDGEVDVCLVRASSTFDFLALLPKLSSGQHVEDENVAYFRASEVTLAFARRIKINTDGELLEASRCHYAIEPSALRVVAPAPGDTG